MSPDAARAGVVDLCGSDIEELPAQRLAPYRIDLRGCTRLRTLPDNLVAGALLLSGCTALTRLPAGLRVTFLDLDGCTALERLPADLAVTVGRLGLRGCRRIERLPAGIGPLAQLDVADCERLTELPDGLDVRSWIDVGGSGLTGLPASLEGVEIRWRGVPVDATIAFAPERLTAAQALAEPNAERRRVMVERMGMERFMAEAGAEVLDEDADPGGPRRLLRVELSDDEPIVCLSVRCPSTARAYLLRVPPDTPSCRHAAAWLAGFDRPEDFRPLLET